MQIEYLIEQAQKASPQLIPIYTLYTHSSDLTALQARAQHCDVPLQPPPHQYGCLVAHAEDIQAEGSIRLAQIASFAIPWHCLVCQCLSQSNSPSGPADDIVALFRKIGRGADDSRDRPAKRLVPDTVPQLPEHIEIIRSGDDPHGRFMEKYAEEWDLGGIAVFDLGEGDDE